MADGSDRRRSRSGDQSQPDGERPTAVLRRARDEFHELAGLQAAAVSSLERTDDGWTARVEVVELERIPDTTSVMATYELTLAADGEVQGYRQTRRYHRNQTEA